MQEEKPEGLRGYSLVYWYVLTWKRAFQFEGRACRSEFAIAGVLYFVGTMILANSEYFAWGSPLTLAEAAPLTKVTMGYMAVALVPWMAASSRRLHDIGYSGWWTAAYLVCCLNLALLGMWTTEGQPHDNEYGPDPMGRKRNPEFAREES